MKNYRHIVSIVFILVILICATGYVSSFYEIFNPSKVQFSLDYLRKTKDAIDEGSNDIRFRYGFLEVHGAFNKFINKKQNNLAGGEPPLYKSNNGYLLSVIGKSKDNAEQNAQKVVNFNSFLKGKNIDLVFVQIPNKSSMNQKNIPKGFKDYSNYNTDIFVDKLKENDVDYIDLRKKIKENYEKNDQIFFKTDHHWKPETAFYSAQEIESHLSKKNKKYTKSSLLNNNKFESKLITDDFLGSSGRKLGKIYSGVDKINFISPKYDTSLNLRIPSKKENKKGSFKDVFYYKDAVKESIYKSNAFGTYLGRDYPLINISNDNIINNKKVLIIKDSFSGPLIPYISLLYKEVDVLDARYYKKQSVMDYVEEESPDLVLVMYNSTYITYDPLTQFGFDKIYAKNFDNND